MLLFGLVYDTTILLLNSFYAQPIFNFNQLNRKKPLKKTGQMKQFKTNFKLPEYHKKAKQNKNSRTTISLKLYAAV